MTYLTVENCERTVEIRRSEFITIVRHVTSEEELFVELNAIRKKYSDATHVCYASVFDTSGNGARFSDDGEPSGTAGAPILDAIKGAGIREVLVAVVRYFGGIKLGAGGLVRAYSSSASDALKSAKKLICEPTDYYQLVLDFSTAKKVTSAIIKSGIRIENTEYSSVVTLTLAVLSGVEITATLADILGAKPNLTFIKSGYSQRPSMEN